MFCKRIIGGVVLKRNVAGTFRTFSENVPATVSRTLPSNLKLADESVLDAPPEPIVPEVERYFPRHPSQIPTETDILSFGTANDVVGKFPLDATVFGAPYRSDIINNVVRYLRHKRRQPKSTKRISDISGSNAKPYPQKGQGKSQVGNKRNSAWRHGQKAHGPKARDYSIGMPKKVRALGMMIVLSAKLREGNLIVLDNFNVESHRTKELLEKLDKHEINAGLNTLFADSYESTFDNDKFALATRNIPWVLSLPQSQLDVYNLMQKPRLVITAAGLHDLQSRVLNQYYNTGKLVKYDSALAQYKAMAEAGRESVTLPKPLELAV